MQAHEVGRNLADRVQGVSGGLECLVQDFKRHLPRLRLQAFGSGFSPTQLGARPLLSGNQPEFARGPFQRRGNLAPLRQAACLLQAGRQHVARKIEHLPGTDLDAEKLHADLVELMRLVENHDPHGWQQFGHAGLAHGQVGKEQMVVDDHDIRCQRLAPCQVDMAGTKLGTLRTEAVFAGRSDQRNER